MLKPGVIGEQEETVCVCFGTMPNKWAEDIYDYDKCSIVHPDVQELDLANGKWFKCKHCPNPTDSEGKFSCRSPFSSLHIVGKTSHMELKTHQTNKEAAEKKKPLAGFFPKQTPNTGGPNSPGGEEQQTSVEQVLPKPKPVCQGACWDKTEPTVKWHAV